jgi:diadenosine tetraphosphate (Ap4A) HIT family hydrolase
MREQCPFREPTEERIFHQGKLDIALWDASRFQVGTPLSSCASLFDATRNEKHELLELVDVSCEAIEAEQPPDGYNIGVIVGVTAGQTIPHLHIHFNPRREGDVPDLGKRVIEPAVGVSGSIC